MVITGQSDCFHTQDERDRDTLLFIASMLMFGDDRIILPAMKDDSTHLMSIICTVIHRTINQFHRNKITCQGGLLNETLLRMLQKPNMATLDKIRSHRLTGTLQLHGQRKMWGYSQTRHHFVPFYSRGALQLIHKYKPGLTYTHIACTNYQTTPFSY